MNQAKLLPAIQIISLVVGLAGIVMLQLGLMGKAYSLLIATGGWAIAMLIEGYKAHQKAKVVKK